MNERQTYLGVKLINIITVTLVALKLGIIPGNPVMSWSWWWVLSPLWLSPIIVIFLFVFGIVAYASFMAAIGRLDRNGNVLKKVSDSKDDVEDSTESDVLFNTFVSRDLDIEPVESEGSIFAPVVEKPKKPPLFQRIKTWYVEGNKKAEERKLEKKRKKKEKTS